MNIDFNTTKSLQELDGEDWGEPTFMSHLATECHRLHRVPLQEFSAENLRILIGQQDCLPFLVPLALKLLAQDPLVSGDHYDGDLLCAVLRVKPVFWQEHPELHNALDETLTRHKDLLSETLGQNTILFRWNDWDELIDKFRKAVKNQ